MENLDKVIKFWRSILDDKESGLPSSILDHIVFTVASLEELKALRSALSTKGAST